MDKYIKYFYNIDSKSIHKNKNNYFFSDKNNNHFCLYNISDDKNIKKDINSLREIYELSIVLHNYNIYCHQIILTLTSEFFILVNNIMYVLLRYQPKYNIYKKITINDLLYYSNVNLEHSIIHGKDNTWKQRWSIKMDYFEYQLSQFGLKHPLLRQSFGYYSGLTELAIALQNVLMNDYSRMNKTLCHTRLFVDESLFDFYNPLYLIIDYKERDFSEYCKNKLFISNMDETQQDILLKDIINFFKYNKYSNYNVLAFFTRFLYATNYFDMFEDIMDKIKNDDMIKSVLRVTKTYETFIKKMYFAIKQHGYIFPHIDWLEKSNHL